MTSVGFYAMIGYFGSNGACEEPATLEGIVNWVKTYIDAEYDKKLSAESILVLEYFCGESIDINDVCDAVYEESAEDIVKQLVKDIITKVLS